MGKELSKNETERVCVYRLTDDEIVLYHTRMAFLSENLEKHVSDYYQSINLNLRNPSTFLNLKNISSYLKKSIVKNHLNERVFAADVVPSNDNKKISRYLFVPKENILDEDLEYASYSFLDGVGFFYKKHDNMKVFTLDDLSD